MPEQDLWSLFGLVMRGQGGVSEEQYWERLYRANKAMMLAHAGRCARSHNLERISAHTLEPQAVVQEAFVRLYLKRHVVRDPRAFVYVTIRNIATNRARKEVRDVRKRDGNKRELQELARQRRRRRSVLTAESIRKVREAVQRLPSKMQADVRAHYYRGQPRNIIAELRNVPTNTVTVSLKRALEKLRGFIT